MRTQNDLRARRAFKAKRDALAERILEANPSNALLAFIAKNWQDPALKAAIEYIAPTASLPPEFGRLLHYIGDKHPAMATFLRVLFGQAANAHSPITDDPAYSRQLGFKEPKAYRDFISESQRPRKSIPRKSKAGSIDPDYQWRRQGLHNLPEVASGLGITPEGLRKMCKRLRIRRIPSTVARRAASIAHEDVNRLLELFLDKPINRELHVREKLSKVDDWSSL